MKYILNKQKNPHLSGLGRYYAKVDYRQEVDTRQITRELAIRSGMSQGTVQAVLTELAAVMQRHLNEGDIVDIDGIGRFKLKVVSVGIDNPADFNPAKHITGIKCLFCNHFHPNRSY